MDNALMLFGKTKRLLRLVSVLFMLFALASCAKPKPTPYVSADWHATPRTLTERNETPYYTIVAKYPEISSYPRTESAQALNQMIHDFVAASIQTFKNGAPRDTAELDDFPDGLHVNALHITYSYQQIKVQRHTFISVRLETDTQYLAEYTHKHQFAAFNYDMNHNKLITLESLFKPDSDYLTVLSTKCRKQLSERLAGGMYWFPYDPTFTGAFPQNFTVWNMENRGLAITFQEYQITPYTEKPTVIVLPYSSLRSILADNSPFRGYAYNVY